ncbi:MAG TPA: alpha-N-arabinofuranosidase [Chthonomonadaceae bacterium]|nr:alpha-N-arabinofuranosidase [Chthonomonadaceae bacterium]
MKQATIVLDADYTLAEVDPRLFGGFAEHLGRHIYSGIYEPDHPTADANGFRQDVVALVRELRMPIMRYPGGNFVSGYRWEDGVGPRDKRPKRLDLAWGALEPNSFGTDEFIDWCRAVDTAPMLAVNLGTRGPEEAQALVEYCNHPGGTAWSDMRRSNGHPEPHNVKVWCLGNEMDGPWQICSKTAWEYGRAAAEAAKLMKWTDPTVETVLCGSSGRGMATFGRWEWEALHEAYGQTDYLSLHTYYGNKENDTPAFLARPDEMADFIREAAALCDAVGASKKQRRKINLSFDEWNVWSQTPDQSNAGAKWSQARPQLEQIYNMEDALVVGGMLITLLQHADRVKIGCMAQVVNVIAPIMTEPGGRAWKQTIFHPFAAASRHGRGTALRAIVNAPAYASKVRDDSPSVIAAAVRGENGLTVFAVNRDPAGEAVTLRGTLRGFARLEVAGHDVLAHADLKAANTAGRPDTVTPSAAPAQPRLDGESLTAELPPYSWNVIRLSSC